MKTIKLLSLISLPLIPIGCILSVGGNHIGDYIIVTGALLGSYAILKE